MLRMSSVEQEFCGNLNPIKMTNYELSMQTFNRLPVLVKLGFVTSFFEEAGHYHGWVYYGWVCVISTETTQDWTR